MKKIGILFLLIALLFGGCYRDDIDDLNEKYDELKKEQERQAELLATYKNLIDALENKLTVSGIEQTTDGYIVTFSNGTKMTVTNGADGHTPVVTIGENGNWFIDGEDTGNAAQGASPKLEIIDGYWYLDDVNTNIKAEGLDGASAPAIVSIVDTGDSIVFYMSDGTTITMGKTITTGLYILSEGSWGGNNSELAYFDVATSTVYQKYFAGQNNGTPLGDTGNDLKLYGSKLYCIVSGQYNGYIEVINPSTGKSIKRIEAVSKNGEADMPRRIAFHDGKAYVTIYSGAVARIDTTSLEIEAYATLSGNYPEGICVRNSSLYVANSGQGSGNTLSVVDMVKFEETETVTVPQNPSMIAAAANGDIYFSTADATWFGGGPSNLHKLDAATNTVTKSFGVPTSKMAIGKNYIYTIETDWDTYGTIAKKVSLTTGEISDFITDDTEFYMGYAVSYNPLSGDVYLTEMGQTVYCFGPDGKLKNTIKTGTTNTTEVVCVNVVK